MSFRKLGIAKEFVKALEELDINTPTEIQEQSIPFLLSKGTDFIGQAQTGTGKTAAFGLPLLHQVDPTNRNVQALILCPTRELGQQIAKQLFRFTKYSAKIFTEAVYGGEKIDRQIEALKRPTQIVVATPGRLIDLVRQKAINLSEVNTVVLDEADEMLSMGFKKELDTILNYTGDNKNTWLFSATMPDGIKRIIHKYMSPDATRIQVNRNKVMNSDITHQYAIVDKADKLQALIYFLQSQNDNRGIIFCKTKASTQTLSKQLISRKFSCDAIHGDLSQKERDKVMRAFKNNKLQTLVATDISARGIDVQNLAFVVHFELPDQLEYFTHRSGRTARAGKRGLSLTIITNQEERRIKEIGRELAISFKRVVS
ncbi:MAG: DEAD/DEAH box helicase [Bacteroidota bacterium]